MRLVIFVNTILQLNFLNITVSVYYGSWSEVNRKERSCPFLFVCFCFTLQIDQSRSIWFRRVSVMSGVWNKPGKSVYLHDHGNHNSPSHQSSSSIIGSLSYGCRTRDCGMNMLSNANQHKDLIQESLVAENSYALPFSKWNLVQQNPVTSQFKATNTLAKHSD